MLPVLVLGILGVIPPLWVIVKKGTHSAKVGKLEYKNLGSRSASMSATNKAIGVNASAQAITRWSDTSIFIVVLNEHHDMPSNISCTSRFVNGIHQWALVVLGALASGIGTGIEMKSSRLLLAPQCCNFFDGGKLAVLHNLTSYLRMIGDQSEMSPLNPIYCSTSTNTGNLIYFNIL